MNFLNFDGLNVQFLYNLLKLLSSSDPNQLKFYLAYLFWQSTWHSIWHIYFDILSDINSDILSHILCDILHSQLKSRIPHWKKHALAVKVRQCPLSGGARRWGPAVPTEIWSSRLRVESKAGGGGGRGGGGDEAGRHAALIKSRDLHLVGGEKHEPTARWGLPQL